MNNLHATELMHHGIMGMHWGIRRYQPYPSDYKGDGKEVGTAIKLKSARARNIRERAEDLAVLRKAKKKADKKSVKAKYQKDREAYSKLSKGLGKVINRKRKKILEDASEYKATHSKLWQLMFLSLRDPLKMADHRFTTLSGGNLFRELKSNRKIMSVALSDLNNNKAISKMADDIEELAMANISYQKRMRSYNSGYATGYGSGYTAGYGT